MSPPETAREYDRYSSRYIAVVSECDVLPLKSSRLDLNCQCLQ